MAPEDARRLAKALEAVRTTGGMLAAYHGVELFSERQCEVAEDFLAAERELVELMEELHG